VKFTGRKLEQKIYYHHTGYPGGIKERVAGKVLGGRFPERVLEKAVERMLPKESPLARKQMTHLRIYKTAEHPHEAQNPEAIAFDKLNAKNVRSV
jgi:large subunit ribosomal protein L13